MTSLTALLDLQGCDTGIDQLRHRQRTLPERATLEHLGIERRSVIEGVVDTRAQRDELGREQKRLEDEVAGVEDKVATVDRQLYGGGVTSPKEAQALQAEMESLKRRQGELEDQVLELMEAIEPLDEELARNDVAVAALDVDIAAAEAALAEAEASISAELDDAVTRRAELTSGVPADLLTTYEELRPQFDGVAVARLQGPTCQGCHLSLSATEVDRLRHEPPDAIVRCPECQRILVR
ncbi:zinc ribbon domain-containing protein [Rhabdothermincola salaria]|uniref:zinc ribbon domain-containing protein n=1 Tax=Rhabdothermincola salaria TaxID=2903142 RepID=UPI001E43F1A0|nr:C4-type zinc ribbon domain-containing protein [Rhabdothermincola salaria]MCD9622403.1 C4-type zinc ribbon domain-containing protein [Rhabdothermincola salaria]